MEEKQVIVPIVDLRREPKARENESYQEDPLQESQCLYGEVVHVKKTHSGWCFVDVPRQAYFTSRSTWSPYSGWVKEASLGTIKGRDKSVILKKTFSSAKQSFLMGTHFEVEKDLPQSWRVKDSESKGLELSKDSVVSYDALSLMGSDEKRALFIEGARSFLGAPYFWGGLGGSPSKLGIDCSGLVHLSARVLNLELPRNAHHQFLSIRRIDSEAMRAGDLIFLSKGSRPGFVHHVMIYIGNGRLIEATADSGDCREIGVKERLGDDLCDLERGMKSAQGLCVFFGAFLL